MRHIIFITILYGVLHPWAEQNYGQSQSIQDWATNNQVNVFKTAHIQVDRASRRLHELTTSLLAEITASK